MQVIKTDNGKQLNLQPTNGTSQEVIFFSLRNKVIIICIKRKETVKQEEKNIKFYTYRYAYSTGTTILI